MFCVPLLIESIQWHSEKIVFIISALKMRKWIIRKDYVVRKQRRQNAKPNSLSLDFIIYEVSNIHHPINTKVSAQRAWGI